MCIFRLGPSLAIAFALICVAISMGLANEVAGKTDEPKNFRIELSGQIFDESGRPIEHAAVTLVAAPGSALGLLFSDLNPDRPILQTASDGEGRFQLGFAAADQRFLAPGESLLVVRARGYQTYLKKLSMSRLQVDVPIRVDLERAKSVAITVVSSEDCPVVGLSVYPASINGIPLPWAVARTFAAAPTDSGGVVSLKQAHPSSIDGIFVVGPGVGYQRLPLRSSSNGRLQAVVAPTRSIEGRITSSERDAIPGIDGVKIFVVSRQQYWWNAPDGAMSRSWAIADITGSGHFQIESIGLGLLSYEISCPQDFPFREQDAEETTLIEAGNGPMRWPITFSRQIKLKAKIIDAVSDEPLPNIYIASSDGRIEPTFTNAKGEADFFQMRSHVSYFPFDATGEYFSASSVFRDTKKLPVNGQIELAPVALNRSSLWRGRVVDQRGKTVPGAVVEYEYSREGFNGGGTACSDSRGRFRLTGVASRTALKLRAVKGHAASDTVTWVLPSRGDRTPKADLALKLIPRPAARLTGRVVDMAGKPVVGVAVTIKRAKVIENENYGREELIDVDFDARVAVNRTNGEGRFEFPPTIAFAQRLQIQVHDPTCFSFHSPFMDGSTIRDKDGDAQVRRLDLGDFQIMKRPGSERVNLLVTSAKGQPIADAEVVVVGARTGTVRGMTNAEGRLQLNARKGPAIIAIAASGYHTCFGETPDQRTSWSFVLQASTTPRDSVDSRSIWGVDQDRFIDAAQRIFAPLERPEPKSSTPYVVALYVEALGTVNPDACVQYILLNVPKNPQLGRSVLAGARKAVARKPELLEPLMSIPFVSDDVRCSGFLTAAQATDDPDLRDEWLGEALVAARRLTGYTRKWVTAKMARGLAGAGRMELAKQVTSQLWSSSDDLREIVKSGKRQQKADAAWTIGPMLAFIDLEQANKLIELTAQEGNVASLETEAKLNWALANPEELATRLQDGSFGPLDGYGVTSWLHANAELSGLGQCGLSNPIRLSQQIHDAKARLAFLVFHARITTDREQQHELVRLAADAIRECKPDAAAGDRYRTHYLGSLLPELRPFENIDPADLDSLVFNALWNLPPQFDTDRLQALLGGAARVVAFRDRHLARRLLEPSIRDLGWLFIDWRTGFNNRQALVAVATIDPDWSVEVTNDLCDHSLRYDQTDQLELRSGMVNALMSAAERKAR